MGFEPKFPVNEGIFKTRKKSSKFRTIKKPAKYTLCRLSFFLVTLTAQNSNHLMEALKILSDV